MVSIAKNVPLAPYTTFKIGGEAEHFAVCKSAEELKELLSFARNEALPATILGGGSNVLVADGGLKGLVIKNEITGIQTEFSDTGVAVRVGAGEVFDSVVATACSNAWWGLENLSHIPGSVGATPIQNVGAYGVEIQDVIQSVEAIDIATGEERTFTRQECDFSYRHSFFKTTAGKQYAITAVTYALSTASTPNISYRDLATRFAGVDVATVTTEEIRNAVIEIRAKKFPDWTSVGTAGSFFKNPIVESSLYDRLRANYPDLPGFPVDEDSVKIPLGWILDKVCNLKGEQVGAVSSYKNQALVIVADTGATAREVSEYAAMVAREVKSKTDIIVEWEVTKLS